MESLEKQKNKLVFIIYTDTLTTIFNSYLVMDCDRLVNSIIKYRGRHGFPITRSKRSYKAELIAHNRMYKMGMFKSHTRDTDLEENIKLWKEIAYFIISL